MCLDALHAAFDALGCRVVPPARRHRVAPTSERGGERAAHDGAADVDRRLAHSRQPLHRAEPRRRTRKGLTRLGGVESKARARNSKRLSERSFGLGGFENKGSKGPWKR